MKLPESVIGLPAPGRFAVIGAASLGAVGAIVGFVVGLFVYAPTAWAAAFEVGIPASLLGASLGLACALIAAILRRI